MLRKTKFRPRISKIKLNPEQAVLQCNCYYDNHVGGGWAHGVHFAFPHPLPCSASRVASNLVDPENLAVKFEPLWNPIPLAFEKKITKWVMPISIALSAISILLSLITLIPQIGNAVFLLETVFPIFLVFFLCVILILKVRQIQKVKPESSLTLLLLLILMPVLTYGIPRVSSSLWWGENVGGVNFWILIMFVSVIILVISALRIRDFENLSVYFYQTTRNEILPLWYQQDTPNVQGDSYWVFRYLYFWPIEITLPLPHSD